MAEYIQDGRKQSRVAPTRPVIDIEISDTDEAGLRVTKTGSGSGAVLVVGGDTFVSGAVIATTTATSGALSAASLAVDTDTLVVNTDSEIGFFGATPVLQQNVPMTTPSVQDVIDALVALGLVEQSDL